MVKKERAEEEEKNIIEQARRARENRQLKTFFISVGIFILIILLSMLIIYKMKNFEQNGVGFTIVKFCDTNPCLTTYQTSLPVTSEGKPADYNFYLRNDPRELEKEITFEGEINLNIPMKEMVINMSSESEIDCNKDGGIAIGNLKSLYTISRINVGKNSNATCDDEGRYIFLQIQPGNETKIKQTGAACYTIEINNCEILKGTERFMIETFEKIHTEWI